MFWENFKRGFAWSIGGIFAYFLARWLKRLALLGMVGGLGGLMLLLAPAHQPSAAKPKPAVAAKTKPAKSTQAKPANKIDEVPNAFR